jgi:hypothetical protein
VSEEGEDEDEEEGGDVRGPKRARPIRTLHLEDLVLLVAKCLSGFTHFLIKHNHHSAQEASCFALLPELIPEVALSSSSATRQQGHWEHAIDRYRSMTYLQDNADTDTRTWLSIQRRSSACSQYPPWRGRRRRTRFNVGGVFCLNHPPQRRRRRRRRFNVGGVFCLNKPPRGGGGGGSTSVECLFSATPLPGPWPDS